MLVYCTYFFVISLLFAAIPCALLCLIAILCNCLFLSCNICRHPIDVVKTRLQVSGDGSAGARNYKALGIGGTVKVIFKEEGLAAFWKGIGAAWLREASYTSLRLGLYAPIKNALGVTADSNFIFKFAAGSAAGAIGSVAGNPFDVLKTRMMASADKNSPKLLSTARTLYKNQGIYLNI